ncbi:MAG: hypothetical protein ABEI52_01805, partial [Halobacteriaceae archaeon]
MASLDEIGHTGRISRAFRLLIGVGLFGGGALILSLGLVKPLAAWLTLIGYDGLTAVSFGLSIGGTVFALSIAGMAVYISNNRSIRIGAVVGTGLVTVSGAFLVATPETALQPQAHIVKMVLFAAGAAIMLTS